MITRTDLIVGLWLVWAVLVAVGWANATFFDEPCSPLGSPTCEVSR